MNKIIIVKYDSETLQTEIIIDGQEFDTSRINNKKIDVWAYPFVLRKVKWNGFYNEMVEALNGEKEFKLIFEGMPEALDELKEAWEDAPVSIISKEMTLVKIIYDENFLETKILINDEPFDTSRINGMEIEDWIYPFVVKKNKWKGIFDELTEIIGSEFYTIQFIGNLKFVKLLKAESPFAVIIKTKEKKELIEQLCTSLSNRAYYLNRIKKYVDDDLESKVCLFSSSSLFSNIREFFETSSYWKLFRDKAKRYVPEKFWNKYEQELIEIAERNEQNNKEIVTVDSIKEDYSTLAENYYYGNGVKRAPKKALKYCKKALEENENDVLAMFIMGNFYLGAMGIEKDLEKAIELFQKSADAGYERAQSALQNTKQKYAEDIYYSGCHEEDEKNYKTAFEYYEKSAKFGNSKANNYLGLIFSEEKKAGKFNKKMDIKRAIECFRIASESGYLVAMYNLGFYLFYDADKPYEAIEWLEKALNSGYEDAKDLLDEIYSYISSENKETIYNPKEHTEYYSCYNPKNFEPFKESEKNFIYSLFFYYPSKNNKDILKLLRDFNNFGKTGRGLFSDNADYFNKIYEVASPQSLTDSNETESERARTAREVADIIVSFWGRTPVISFLSHFLEVIKSMEDDPEYYKSLMENYTEESENEQVIIKYKTIMPKVENLVKILKEDFDVNKNSIFSFINDISSCSWGDIMLYNYERSFAIEDKNEQNKCIRKSIYTRLMFIVLNRICDVAIHFISNGLLDNNNNTSDESDDNFFDSI